MKAPVLVLAGIVLGCAAGAVGLAPTPGHTQASPAPVGQYCTDTHDFNNVEALDALVRKAGQSGWELIGVYRPTPLGANHTDYVCFKQR